MTTVLAIGYLPSGENRDAVIGQMSSERSELRCVARLRAYRRTRLRLTVFRRLLACMAATKPSISLSAVSLETGAPELGTPDLTEFTLLFVGDSQRADREAMDSTSGSGEPF